MSCVPLSLDATRRRAFGLVSQAYTSIVADDFAAFVGLPVEEAVKGTWHYSLSSFYTDDELRDLQVMINKNISANAEAVK